MVEFNGSNAYQMRYEEGAAEKKKQQPEAPEKKRIQPNMTLKLNRRKKSKPVLPHKPVVKKGRSLDAGEVRLLFAGGFAFCVLIAFFSFILRCNASNNELRNTLNEKKYLYTFLEDGDVPIDNNRAENAIRHPRFFIFLIYWISVPPLLLPVIFLRKYQMQQYFQVSRKAASESKMQLHISKSFLSHKKWVDPQKDVHPYFSLITDIGIVSFPLDRRNS